MPKAVFSAREIGFTAANQQFSVIKCNYVTKIEKPTNFAQKIKIINKKFYFVFFLYII